MAIAATPLAPMADPDPSHVKAKSAGKLNTRHLPGTREQIPAGFRTMSRRKYNELLVGPLHVPSLEPGILVMDARVARRNSAFLSMKMCPNEFKKAVDDVDSALEDLAEVRSRPAVRRRVPITAPDVEAGPLLPSIEDPKHAHMIEEYKKLHPEEGAKLTLVEDLQSFENITTAAAAVAMVPVGYVLTRGVMATMTGVLFVGAVARMLARQIKLAQPEYHGLDVKETVRRRDDWWEKEWLFSQDPSLDNRDKAAARNKAVPSL